jgi:hypothetical protein
LLSSVARAAPRNGLTLSDLHRENAMMPRHLQMMFVLAAFLVAGCASTKRPLAYTVLSEAQATELADAFLAGRQINWGKAVGVRDVPEQHRFVVVYSTPENEKLMVGDRGVYVSKIDGSTRLMPQL